MKRGQEYCYVQALVNINSQDVNVNLKPCGCCYSDHNYRWLNYWRGATTEYQGADISSSAGGRGASVSTCAGLTNQLLSCWVDPRIAWIKHWHSNYRWLLDGGGGTPRYVLNWCKKNPIWRAWLASSYLWAFRMSLSLIKFKHYIYIWAKGCTLMIVCVIWLDMTTLP